MVLVNDDNSKGYDVGYYYDSSDNLLAIIGYTPDATRTFSSAKKTFPTTDDDVLWIDWWGDGQSGTVDTTKTKMKWARTYAYTPS